MSFYKRIFAQTSFQTLTKLVTAGSGFAATLILAFLFGTQGYGDYTKIVTVVTLFYLFIDFGLNATLLRIDKENKHLTDVFFLRALIAVCCMGLLLLFAFIKIPYVAQSFNQHIRFGILIYSATLLSQAIFLTSSAQFQRTLSYEKQFFASSVGAGVSVLLLLFVSVLHLPLLYAIGSLLCGAIVSSFFALRFAKILLHLPIDWGFIKKLFSLSLPLGIMLVCNLIYFRIDTILLSIMKSSSDVGIYGLAYRFFDFLIALPLFLSNSLYISLLSQEKFKNLSHHLSLFFLVSLAFTIPSLLFAPLLGLIHAGFENAVFPFRLLVISLPVFFLTSILQWHFIAIGDQKFLAVVYAVFALINILLNIIFIPYGTYVASAIITGLCETGVLIILFFRLTRLKKYTN